MPEILPGADESVAVWISDEDSKNKKLVGFYTENQYRIAHIFDPCHRSGQAIAFIMDAFVCNTVGVYVSAKLVCLKTPLFKKFRI